MGRTTEVSEIQMEHVDLFYRKLSVGDTVIYTVCQGSSSPEIRLARIVSLGVSNTTARFQGDPYYPPTMTVNSIDLCGWDGPEFFGRAITLRGYLNAFQRRFHFSRVVRMSDVDFNLYRAACKDR